MTTELQILQFHQKSNQAFPANLNENAHIYCLNGKEPIQGTEAVQSLIARGKQAFFSTNGKTGVLLDGRLQARALSHQEMRRVGIPALELEYSVIVWTVDIVTGRIIYMQETAHPTAFEYGQMSLVNVRTPAKTASDLLLQSETNSNFNSTIEVHIAPNCEGNLRAITADSKQHQVPGLPPSRQGLSLPRIDAFVLWRMRLERSVFVAPYVTYDLHPEGSAEGVHSFTVKFTELPPHQYFDRFCAWIRELFSCILGSNSAQEA